MNASPAEAVTDGPRDGASSDILHANRRTVCYTEKAQNANGRTVYRCRTDELEFNAVF